MFGTNDLVVLFVYLASFNESLERMKRGWKYISGTVPPPSHLCKVMIHIAGCGNRINRVYDTVYNPRGETAYFMKVVLISNCIHDCTGILKK